MKALRASLVAAGLLVLSATTLPAQSTRISCKDGSKPKIGHFSCWGHGGLVREAAAAEPMKATPKATKPSKPAKAKAAKKATKPATTKKKKKATSTPPVSHPQRQSAK